MSLTADAPGPVAHVRHRPEQTLLYQRIGNSSAMGEVAWAAPKFPTTADNGLYVNHGGPKAG